MKQLLSIVGLCLFLMVGISWQVGAYDEDDLEKLKATGDCSGCALSESDLAGANLTGAIFCKTKMPDVTINNSGC